MHKLTALAAILTALVLTAPGLAAPPRMHTNLGDDPVVGRDIAGDTAAPPISTLAASQRGCVTDLISTNFSSRNGVKPRLPTAHLTVSRNSPGWGDVNAIRSFFDRDPTDASSNYIIDAEGNCKLIVPETAKAWTQGAFNPWAISIEFIHFSTTDPKEPWTEAQLRKGALVFADASKRWGIPVRLVNPAGCNVPPGITDHDRLECENAHVDVGTQEAGDGVHRGTFPMTRFLRYVREASAPPVQIVHFVLGSGEGRGIATSGGVTAGPNEAARLREFLAFRNAAALKELRADGDFNVVRKNGKP